MAIEVEESLVEGDAGERAVLSSLNNHRRFAVFSFSEDPFTLGCLGEVVCRLLHNVGTGIVFHDWARGTRYKELSCLSQNSARRFVRNGLSSLGVVGGSRALTRAISQRFGSDFTVDTCTAVPVSARHERLLDELAQTPEVYAAKRPLLDFEFDQQPVGWAVSGSLSHLLSTSVGNTIIDEAQLRSMMSSFVDVLDAADSVLRSSKPDCVVLFNGRLLHDWAVRIAAKRLAIPVVAVEAGSSLNRFSVYQDSAHEIGQSVAERLEEAWRFAPSTEIAERVASQWFEARRPSHNSTNPYVHKQRLGSVPARDGRRRVTFFSTSSDEFEAAGPQWSSRFGEHDEIILRLARRAKEDPNIEFIVRLHPNMNSKNLVERRLLSALKAALATEATVIDPDSPVDSYALAESSDLVLSMHSTLGIEAPYWGIPSATFSPTLFDSLGATTAVSDFDSSLYIDLTIAERAARKARALPYGHYCATFGFDFSYYRHSGGNPTFLGAPLRDLGRFASVPDKFGATRRLKRRRRDLGFE